MWHHTNTVKLLKNTGCQTNIPNTQGDIPMDIATRKGYDDVIAQLSSRDLMESIYNCKELQRFISQRKDSLRADQLKQPSWAVEDIEEASAPKSQILQSDCKWREQLHQAHEEVVTRCERRIAAVEEQCRARVEATERQCSERLLCASLYLPSITSRCPSAPYLRKLSSNSSCSSLGSSICAEFSCTQYIACTQ